MRTPRREFGKLLVYSRFKRVKSQQKVKGVRLQPPYPPYNPQWGKYLNPTAPVPNSKGINHASAHSVAWSSETELRTLFSL